MIDHPEVVVTKVLDPGETLIWSCQPDVQAMAKTTGRRRQRKN